MGKAGRSPRSRLIVVVHQLGAALPSPSQEPRYTRPCSSGIAEPGFSELPRLNHDWKFNMLGRIVLCAALSAPISASADSTGRDTLRELLSHQSMESRSSSATYLSCSDLLLSHEDAEKFPVRSQYIFNAMYTWAEIDIDKKKCIYILDPVHTGLSSEDASRFMSATELEFPVPPDPVKQGEGAVRASPVDSTPREHTIDLRTGEPVEEEHRDTSSDPCFQLIDSGAPFNSITLVQTGTASTGGSTAVQVSPFVHVTAAHVIAPRGTRP